MRGIEDISAFQEVDGKAAQQWVRRQNKNTRKNLDKTATFRRLSKECRYAKKKNETIEHIWLGENGLYQRVFVDEKNPKGLLQEIENESYLSDSPEWKTLLDIDFFAKQENKNWEFSCIDDAKFNRKVVSMIGFSDAGSDAYISREFNIKTKKFVENGFLLPKARSDITWYSSNTLLLATDYGENVSAHTTTSLPN